MLNDDPFNALKEINIFLEEGVDGVILENYFGSTKTIIETLNLIPDIIDLKIGINILPNEYDEAFKLAGIHNLDFIQLDYIAGRYQTAVKGACTEVDFYDYMISSKQCSADVHVMGGVWPKYYQPVKDSDLKEDLDTAKLLANSIVVTGEGTGKETPIDKIKKFRSLIGNHPLIAASGVNEFNIEETMEYCDGVIIGSSFKHNGQAHGFVDRYRVRNIVKKVK